MEPVLDRDLGVLADLAEEHHRTFANAHPRWAQNLLATCLCQGAARHRVHLDRGVKDLDVFLFYACPAALNGGRFPWNRHLTHVDFGESAHGRPSHTEQERADPNLAKRIPDWERFEGRRVDLMARAIAAHPDGPRAAIRAWLKAGAKQTRRRSDSTMPTPWWLARTPVVCLSPDLGAVWWQGPSTDEVARERGI